jgi:hypothetical protein
VENLVALFNTLVLITEKVWLHTDTDSVVPQVTLPFPTCWLSVCNPTTTMRADTVSVVPHRCCDLTLFLDLHTLNQGMANKHIYAYKHIFKKTTKNICFKKTI